MGWISSRNLMLFFIAASLPVRVVSAADGVFAAKPAVETVDDEARITFEVLRPTDVEVAVLDAKGTIVRHLAAGMLGGTELPPPPLDRGLRQSLTWDGHDDSGRAATGGPFKVRVRAAMQARLGRRMGDPATLHGKVYGLATDAEGNVYITLGAVYASTPVYSIKVLDPHGRYLRTILPPPAELSAEEAREFGARRSPDGFLQPKNHHALVPYVHDGGIVAFLGNRVRAGQLWLLNTRGRICRIRADNGAPVVWDSGPETMTPSGGPMCWAVAADGRSLYLAGWWNAREKQGARGDGVVRRVDPASGKATELFKVTVPPDSPWLTEVNGWYHFKNWGRKNGQAALHGLAVDEDGRLYVCDRVNQRLAVYDQRGRLAGSTPLEWGDSVVLGEDATVYLVTRRVVDGYKAVNEFEVVKLDKAIDGKVLARLRLDGRNAPQMAVSTSTSPPVIWLSNVGSEGERLARIEDRGDRLVVESELTTESDAGVVKLWTDPLTDDVYVNNGWNRLTRYDGLTGERQTLPEGAIDLAIGPDRNLYLVGRKGWKEPIYRSNRDFEPVAFEATGRPTAVKDVYGRYGTGWSNKGLAVAPDGRIYVRHMYDWNKYHVLVFRPDGSLEKHGRVADGIIGPIDGRSGGLRVDRQGNIYVSMSGHPRSSATEARSFEGCVVKVAASGGGLVDQPGSAAGIAFERHFFEGAVAVYPHLAPRQGPSGCVCKEARFDVDAFGRIYVPNVLDFCIRVFDNEGHLILRFGHYGNPDSKGASIPLGWPMSCGVNRAGRVYIADVLNHRIVRVDLDYRAKVEIDVN